MHEMKLKSLGLFIGTGECNADCAHCGGKPLRKFSPKKDGIINEKLIYKTLKEGYLDGARSVSLSSAGEPTLSPKAITKALNLLQKLKKEGVEYNWVNLYSNGIRIGQDKKFCEEYLPLWEKLGLKTIYITVHDIDEEKNAQVYQIKKYPLLKRIVSRIHNAGLLIRANLVLTKKNFPTCKKFISMVKDLREIGFDHISSWPIRTLEDKIDLKSAPIKKELDKMEKWVNENQEPNCRIRLLREKNRNVSAEGQKLTLFQNGKLTNTWC